MKLDNIKGFLVSESEDMNYDFGRSGQRGGSGGESDEHRRIKELVAANPSLIGLTNDSISELEHVFISDDRVDVLIKGGGVDYTVVEVEISGELNLIKGIHQAIKYRSMV